MQISDIAWATFQRKFELEHLGLDGRTPFEIKRAARRFGAVAFAGEIASQHGVTGWSDGEAARSAALVFEAWLEGRAGPGSADAENAVRQVRHFLESHG